MKAKRDKKIENQMDREFKKLKVKPHVYYFKDVPSFQGVTVVTAMPAHWDSIASSISDSQQSYHLFNSATYLLQNLAAVHDLYGVAICDKRDTFSRQEGRLRAKRRLLRHLKGRGDEIARDINIEEKRKKVIALLSDEACEMCECSCGDRHSNMTELDADLDMTRVQEVADKILAIFEEAKP